MKIIDFHVHLFPDTLAGRTMEKLSHTAADEYGDAPYFTDATVTGTLQKLTEWGVDMVQGYYFSPPVPADKIQALLSGM